MQTYDTVVVGLGVMGSAALYEAARRGLHVLGVEQFPVLPHGFGSSHGLTRVIRQAYFEDPRYVPLIRRAYRGWHALQQEAGRVLFHRRGGLMIGPPDSHVIQGTLAAAAIHGLPHAVVGAGELRATYPDIAVPPGHTVIFEPEAGFLAVEEALTALLERARALGAAVRIGRPATRWASGAHGVTVWIGDEPVSAHHLIVTAGPWLSRWASPALTPVTVERQVMVWFEPEQPTSLERLPVFIVDGVPHFYGFPYIPGQGMKVAIHHHGALTDPDTVDRAVGTADTDAVRAAVRRLIPKLADAPIRSAEVCLYTNTPDFHFLIGPWPEQPRVTLAGGFSGHGFKFAPAVGQVLIDFAMGVTPDFDLGLFDPHRLAVISPPASGRDLPADDE